METKKCSLPEHKEIKAIFFCQECKIYMCINCEKIHSGLLINHHKYKLDKDIKDIFTGFCKEENHIDKLEYFCKTHNQLCCSSCIVKVKKKGKGQHTDCDVCIIEDIKNEKMNKLKENITYLENQKNSFKDIIEELKTKFEKINENKEVIKLNIQKIFTKIRNVLNEREDELLLKVDEIYDSIFLKEKNLKEYEKLPNNIKISIERGKIMGNEWDDEKKLSILINDCINIENYIKDINLINEKINKFSSNNSNIEFNPKEEEINKILDTLKNFGNIYLNSFKNSQIIISNTEDYKISGEKNNIITKIGGNYYRGTLIKNELEKDREYIWKIKMLNSTDYNHFFIGVAPGDFNIKSSYYNCGWYYYCFNSKLNSGPPFNYNDKSTNLKLENNELTVIMNMKERELKFVDNRKNIAVYQNIPIDKPLYPAIFMYYTNDSIQIIKC